MKRIEWTFYGEMPRTLCVGEEKTLTAEEIAVINAALRKIWTERTKLAVLFDQARERFRHPAA